MMFCRELNWTGLYSQSYDLWCDESYSHPAKMAVGLCFKIIEHLKEWDLLQPNSVVLDFMGGIGTTAICSCLKGYRAITVELESKFVKLQEDNKAYVEAKTYRKLDWEILQGDSRELSKLLTERGLIGLCSPPYYQAGDVASGGTIGIKGRDYARQRHGDTEGQIANLPDKVIGLCSPPYGEITVRDIKQSVGKRWVEEHKGAHENPTGYSSNPANIGNLPDHIVGIVSPPYGEGTVQGKPEGGIDWNKRHTKFYKSNLSGMPQAYSSNPDNIGNLIDKLSKVNHRDVC